MNLTATDRTLVRDLAKQVAEVAALAIQAERRELWKRHNRLERIRPMILVFPEGSWAELLPDAVLQCETDAGRGLERALRTRLYYHDHLSDDTVIEDEWVVHKAVHVTGWGLQAKHIPSTLPRGAWAFDPVIDKPADLKQLTFPEVSHDEAATQRNLETAQELFGDILTVKLKGVCHVSFHPMALYTRLRGLEQVMVDMVAEPTWLHEAMAFLEAGYRRQVQQYVDQNLLDLNNDSTYHSSGGNGYSTELPKSDCDPDRIRPADMWASAEAQELAQVSPDMHYEFSLQYESACWSRSVSTATAAARTSPASWITSSRFPTFGGSPSPRTPMSPSAQRSCGATTCSPGSRSRRTWWVTSTKTSSGATSATPWRSPRAASSR